MRVCIIIFVSFIVNRVQFRSILQMKLLQSRFNLNRGHSSWRRITRGGNWHWNLFICQIVCSNAAQIELKDLWIQICLKFPYKKERVWGKRSCAVVQIEVTQRSVFRGREKADLISGGFENEWDKFMVYVVYINCVNGEKLRGQNDTHTHSHRLLLFYT